MNLYAFEFGRQKGLSYAELLAVLGADNLVDKNFDTAIFQLPDQDFTSLQDHLGGTIKIIQILHQFQSPTPPNDQIQDQIEKILQDEFQGHSGKIPFSICHLSYKKDNKPNIKSLLNFSKKILKSLDLNSRFVNKMPASENPKPSTIYKAKIIEKGIDLCLIQSKKNLFLGKSIAIQNIDSYSKRDYDKPRRDARIGMLPPKLAQIMINLAGPSKTIYDPFCGTGTVLTEALLMGKDVIGSDHNPQMVEASDTNCRWLAQQYHSNNKFRAFEADARFITKQKLPEKIDTIVTESYLGRLFSKLPNPKQVDSSFRELANLHFNWLRAIHPLLPKHAKVITCVTAYDLKKEIAHLPRFAELAQEAGFKILDTHLYGRAGQIVLRDINILEKL